MKASLQTDDIGCVPASPEKRLLINIKIHPLPIERWCVFEFEAHGPADGNPFREVTFEAVFETAGRRVDVRGFYDGDGVYRVRFMPDIEGTWRFVTRSNRKELDNRTGSFACTAPAPGNHGPVRVCGDSHFCYGDGSPCFIMGTTAYAWTYRPEDVRAQTLKSFARYGFNKIRMLVFPKEYGDGKHVDASYAPPCFPYKGKPGQWDYSRFDPEYFRNYEDRVMDLMRLGIEADVILFHPYDKSWQLPHAMSEADDLFYLDYLVARLAAYRNVWWSLANEYDLFCRPNWREKDWDKIGKSVAARDPYGHPISIHNWPFVAPYPNRSWMTHVSYQHPNTFSLMLNLLREYGKPVINDEYQYEGSIPNDWGNCTGEQVVRRHWMSVMAGGYATHGEVLSPSGVRDFFWAYGGTLRGAAPPRLAYMRQLIENLPVPYHELSVDARLTDGRDIFCAHRDEDFYLYFITPEFKDRKWIWVGAAHGPRSDYELVVHDVWSCCVVSREIRPSGQTRLELPQWAAVTASKK